MILQTVLKRRTIIIIKKSRQIDKEPNTNIQINNNKYTLKTFVESYQKFLRK